MAERQGFRHQLSQDERGEGEGQDHDDEGGRLGHGAEQGDVPQEGRDGANGSRAAHCRGEGADERHADLDRGEKAVWVVLQVKHALGPHVATAGELLDAAPPGGDHGDFGGGEEAVAQNEDPDEDHLQPGREKHRTIHG